MLSRWSSYLLRGLKPVPKLSWPIVACQVLCGTTVGLVSAQRGFRESVFLCVVTALLIVQVPLDVLCRRLARTPTFVAFLASVPASLLAAHPDLTIGEMLGTTVAAILVFIGFFVIHFVAPKSLGFGDVLLVLPLSLAMAFSTEAGVMSWIAFSSGSGVTHALITFKINRKRYIPFGPHMIGVAWLLLLVNA